MNIIAAVDKHWAIGNRGKLLVTIPDDQKLFREETKGKVIVMGRKTLERLPGGQPVLLLPLMWLPCRKIFWKASCSAMKKAPLQEPKRRPSRSF